MKHIKSNQHGGKKERTEEILGVKRDPKNLRGRMTGAVGRGEYEGRQEGEKVQKITNQK